MRMRWLACLGLGLTCALFSGACGSSSGSPTGNAPGDGGNGGTGGGAGSGGADGGGGGSGGSKGDGGNSPTDGSKGGDGPATGGSKSEGGADSGTNLPWLTVQGNVIKDPAGNTVILRGVDIPDIGSLMVGTSSGVEARLNEILSTSTPSLDSHVVRLPVYPETTFNSGSPYYSPEPYPVGTPAPAGTTPAPTILSAADYISTVLKPAVEYAASKNLYAIIDYHQIDDTTSGTGPSQSATDAVTFWTTVAPAFSTYSNVLFEAFNEPIDSALNGWNTTFQTVAQSWVTTIRAGAPKNIIIVGSPSWSQHPEGVLTYPLTPATNLVFTAHVYPGNYPGSMNSFQNNITTAIAAVPVFMSEWGYTQKTPTGPYDNLDTPGPDGGVAPWAASLQTYINGNGASWTAWVADPSWGPPMFMTGGSGLTEFGTFVQAWLAADVNMNWVQ